MDNMLRLDPHSFRWIILFGGAGREGIVLRMHEKSVSIIKVLVPKRKSPRLASSIRTIRSAGLEIDEVEKGSLDRDMLPFAGTCLLSIGFPYIIASHVYLRHRIALNIHPTLLPKYRGPTTGAYVLMNRESVSGSTIHLLGEKADCGDILAQNSVPLSPFDTIRSLQRKVYSEEPALVLDVFDRLKKGIDLKPQDESEASEYPSVRTPADSEIDARVPLVDLVDRIRACDPEQFPAFFQYEGTKLCVKLWRPEKKEDEHDML